MKCVTATGLLTAVVLVIGAAPVSAQPEIFFAHGWMETCRPVLERVARNAERSDDGESNQRCVSYLVGIADGEFVNRMKQGNPCPAHLANREEVMVRTLKAIESLSQADRARMPMAVVVTNAVADQCGGKGN
jgi:hypothetical protein